MTNKIFKQYIGTLEAFETWLGTGTNKINLGDAIVFIHANDTTDSNAKFTGWIYANGHYYQSGSTLTLTDVASILADGHGVHVRTEGDKIYFDAVVERDILIAGGPLASTAVAGVFTNGTIPAGMTIQTVLEKLFLKEIWSSPTGPTYTFTTSVNAPTTTLSSTSKVQVGSTVACSTTANTTQTVTQSATISGYTYGYSIGGTAKTSSSTSYTQSPVAGKTGSTSLLVTFSGLYNVGGTTIANATIGDTTIAYVGEGTGTYSATYTGQSVIGGTFTTVDVYNISNIGNISSDKKTISQAGFADSSAYNGGTLAAPTASSSKTVTGVWGYFYTSIGEDLPSMTSDDIRTWTWVDSRSSSINIGTDVYGIAIACPTGSITNIDQSNPVSSFGTINVVGATVAAENNYNASHSYKVCYIKNDGPTTTPQKLTITYA